MNKAKKQAHAYQAHAFHAAAIAARNAGPAPTDVPPDATAPNAAFVDLINRYNIAELECHRLMGEVVNAILKRKGDMIRIGEDGALLHQTIGNPGEWDAGRRPRVLIVERLGSMENLGYFKPGEAILIPAPEEENI